MSETHIPGIDDVTAEPVPTPSELPVAPNLGASEKELAALGRQLDERDFAEALSYARRQLGVPAPYGFATGGIVESTVDADHPPVGLGCPEAQAGRVAIVYLRPTKRRPWWRRIVDRIRRRPR